MDNVLGGIVAFSSGKNGHIDIWTFDLDSGQINQVTKAMNCNTKPCFSPDGQWIVFTSNRTGKQEIFKTAVNSKGVACQLTESQAWCDSPRISPDGSRIAYVSNESGTMDIWVMDFEGKTKTRITEHSGSDTFVSWTPDGRGLVWSADRKQYSDIWYYDLQTNEKFCLSESDHCDFYPVVSPCGTVVAFVSDRPDGTDAPASKSNEIWLMGIDGSSPVQITKHQACDEHVCWSPCGRNLMYASSRDHSNRHVRIIEVGDLVDSYATEQEVLIAEEAIKICQSAVQLRGDEDQLGHRNTTYLTKWLPEKWHDSHYPPEYFGEERFPHWISIQNQNGTKTQVKAAGAV